MNFKNRIILYKKDLKNNEYIEIITAQRTYKVNNDEKIEFKDDYVVIYHNNQIEYFLLESILSIIIHMEEFEISNLDDKDLY
ncbi:hypothetical protein [Methanobrevibacter sp. DSM 116169]|uniref:hypothetical protein n=1 Tax=Methanobrevibacter sp. DSM 116169 TaxID=3242727 RepID=UPI0038FBF4DC